MREGFVKEFKRPHRKTLKSLSAWLREQLLHDLAEMRQARNPELKAYYEGAVVRLRQVMAVLHENREQKKTR